MATRLSHLLVVFVVCLLCVQDLLIAGVRSATFTFSNNCDYTVWPGLLSGAGTSPLASTGFQLDKGETRSISAPTGWSGRFWGRTLCSTDSAGKFSCGTADCGTGTMECSGTGAVPPATLAEFTLDGGGGMDFYDVSLVDGYNLPMLVVPQGAPGGGGNNSCITTGCVVDLNARCPSELKVMASGEGVACRSACEAFSKPEYCCSGDYANPNTCQPTSYSQLFKDACPRAYSYAFDDRSSTFTCPGGTSYLITYCPPAPSQKKSDDSAQAVPTIGGGGSYSAMVYQGALVSSGTARSSSHSAPLIVVVAVVASFLLRRLLL